ncbi:thiamine-monophosphate kinase [Pseudoalteromonas porphyrae]|uniref:Thiamine-monophosphate kinase n=2 Tax=Pseudoalteromonas TaxID=53246 RepID=A0A0N1EHG4_9GAMM|nr:MULTISPECIES: thiamine-phosphate kinase [Pseudoalteromonas]KPH60715.1 thiamine-monophosphate kinase [Pseudoalteromonas porphyrae]KPH93507.1 thiamine-monophosphate kinase [Pseudoalteromonas porphyrae]NMR24902.1 thiamine-phosphate kinase [Pseudoalteromonas sp. NEC-BIFX-2020_015]NNG43500.1 thiamine-phosphate kinase [Pseudoalteromonas sp. NEC-BIFX-2020_002]
MKEFELINRYFKGRGITRRDVNLGIGDDCALVTVPQNCQLAITTDTLVAGVHFFDDIAPRALGHRVLAVNLSDLAAMGAEPTWVSVALTLPNIDVEWLEEFTEGMHEIAEYFNVQIIGGDTTQGPLSITICAKGIVPEGKALRRSGAKIGDWIYVTGPLGDAGLAIEARKQGLNIAPEHLRYVNQRFDYPTPRVAAGQVLRGFASSAIDISDGLLADLGHIVGMSQVNASINVNNIPTSDAMRATLKRDQQLPFILNYGDDYELLFTVPDSNKSMLEMKLRQYGVDASCIGQIKSGEGLIELMLDGNKLEYDRTGFEHFTKESV